MRPVGTRETELVKEPRDTPVEHTETFAGRLGVRERAGEVALAGACRARDDHGLMLVDPTAARELSHDSLVELALVRGKSIPSMHASVRSAVFASRRLRARRAFSRAKHLGVHEHREALVEGQGEGIGRLVLLQPCPCEDAQAERMKLLERGFSSTCPSFLSRVDHVFVEVSGSSRRRAHVFVRRPRRRGASPDSGSGC